MIIKEEKNSYGVLVNICIVLIWLTVFYSSIIQHKYLQISHGMLILGLITLCIYIMAHCFCPYDILGTITIETRVLLAYMIYMLFAGAFFSPDVDSHIEQWITSAQYLFLLILISSLIQETKTDTFHWLLLIRAIILVYVFLMEPIYYGGHRYSISLEMNPNGLGMAFATGVWAALYQQQKRNISLIISFSVVVIFTYCVFKTGSRKALIAIGISVILWLLLCFFPSLKKCNRNKRILSVFVILIIIGISGWLFTKVYYDSVIATRMEDLLYETQEGNRSNMYRAGFDMFKTSPLFGIGYQGFKYYYGLYSHATLVETPVSGGIIGAIIYFFAYYISIKRTIHCVWATREKTEYETEHMRAKMLLIMWGIMLFYTTCIIHQYILDSYIVFGIIFGDTAYIEKRIGEYSLKMPKVRIGSKYIK